MLVFSYTAKYPDAAPLVEIEDTVNFEDDHENRLLEHVNETVRDSLCAAFFFPLAQNSTIIAFFLFFFVRRSPKTSAPR